jgi:two-component system, OmpR family, heavy metal sensor histidine kinase CusS
MMLAALHPSRWLCAWRSSMTRQIALAITAVSVVLVAVTSACLVRLTTESLREGGDMVMLANLVFLEEDLQGSQADLKHTASELVNRIEWTLGTLHVALLDEGRNVIAASDGFDLPIDSLPRATLSMDELPARITHQKVRWLQQRYGPLAANWRGADGRMYRVLLARLSVPAKVAGTPHTTVLAALALELQQTREVVARGWKIFAVALVASALLALVLGTTIARHIVRVAQRLGAAATRISARALHERLALKDTPRELLDSGIAFNHMLDRLESSFKRLSEFSSDLAHDLRTPVNNLLGEAQVALSRPRSAAEYRAVLESAVEDYERISRLIENMLFLARADDARASLQREWIELGHDTDQLHDYFEPLAEERGVAIVCNGCAQKRRVWADRVLLRRAIANLVANALRHATPGSTVTIDAALHAGGACTLEVSNEGPPIAPEHQARIFDRLYRIDPSRGDSASGAGLGLAIVKSIMDLHGGRAVVRSAPGERTVFGLWFPGPPAPQQPVEVASPTVLAAEPQVETA